MLALLNGALRRMVVDDDFRDVVEQQEQAVDAMSRLINALLDISKLESGAIKLELTDFDLGPLFNELRREFAGMARSKGLLFTADSPRERIRSDPALLGQVLRNLISNAIKYTQSGSVELRCEADARRLRIEVRDTGIGIAADQLPHIFEEFYQIGVSPNSSREGYGLGLSIVQRIAKLLDLKISVRSTSGIGSMCSSANRSKASARVKITLVSSRERAIARPASRFDASASRSSAVSWSDVHRFSVSRR